jgi:glycosyltransferase involved in cell wall biosynthesis
MRLAFLTHEPFHPPSGGGSSEALYLVDELVARGHEVHLFCPKLADPEFVRQRFKVRLHEFRRWEMGRYTGLRTPKYLLYPFFLERMVAEAARETPFDVALAQHSIAAVAAGRLKRRIGCRVVMNFLDFLTGFMETWPPLLAPPPLLALLKRFELSLPRRYGADGALTISDTFTDLLVANGCPRERIRAIYFGFDAALFPEPPATPPTPPPGAPAVILMHGSLDHHHLGPIALEAARRVADARPGTIFRFVGRDTPALQRFRAQAASRSPRVRIECTGFVPYDSVGPHLLGATVGIIPYEASSGVHCAFVAKAVEYLAVGLPAVSTPLRSIQTYFRDEPLLRFAGFDGASFADAILSWLEEPPSTRARLGPAASRRVRAELDWGAISRRAVDFVEEIAGSSRGNAATVSGR